MTVIEGSNEEEEIDIDVVQQEVNDLEKELIGERKKMAKMLKKVVR